jgi:hypothetical protein
MEPVFLIALAVVVVVMIGLAHAYQHTVHVRHLQQLASRLDEGRADVDEGWFANLDGARVRGKLDGHRVHVGYTVVREGSGKNSSNVTHMRAKVEVSDPVARKLSIERAGMLKKVGRFLGLVRDVKTGDKRIDDKYILNGRPRALGQLLSDPKAEEALDALLNAHGFGSVNLTGTWLFVDQRTSSTGPTWLKTVLSRLVQVAKLCDRKQIKLKVLGEKIHFAWTGGGEDALCPYCRDGIHADDLELVACKACDTVHHRECLDEAGGCVVFGCGGGRGATGRTRAR